MIFSKNQKKIIDGKFNGCLIVKGEKYTGKTISCLNRVEFLKNNYCLFDEDNILMIVSKEEKSIIKEMYKNINVPKEISFFSYNKETFNIKTIDDIIEENHKNIKIKLLDDNNVKINILKKCLSEIKNENRKSKILKYEYMNYFLDEFNYIRSNLIHSLEDYQNFTRRGRNLTSEKGPKSIGKNSSTREIIYALMKKYEKHLKEKNLIDYVGFEKLILDKLRKEKGKNYSHIVIDSANNYSSLEIEMLKELISKKDYSNIILNIDTKANLMKVNINTLKEIFNDYKIRSICLRKKYVIKHIEKSLVNGKSISLDDYQFVDLRYSNKFNFSIDNSEKSFLLTSDNKKEHLKEEELETLPLFNEIAAGEPILINDSIEGTFTIPKFWLRGSSESFMLKVKGDSMKNININDGDYVIIRKQYNANTNDIIAVNLDGSATLKRLKINKDTIILKPENEKYDPINITENESVTIIGKAIGVIKKI